MSGKKINVQISSKSNHFTVSIFTCKIIYRYINSSPWLLARFICLYIRLYKAQLLLMRPIYPATVESGWCCTFIFSKAANSVSMLESVLKQGYGIKQTTHSLSELLTKLWKLFLNITNASHVFQNKQASLIP